jgi:hypothetical protein
VKRFSQLDVCNRALLDRKVFDELRCPVGLGDMARVRRRWFNQPTLRKRWVRMTISMTFMLVAIWAIFIVQSTPQMTVFLSRAVAIGAYLFALIFLLFPPDPRLVALCRVRVQAARQGDVSVMNARRQAWIEMLRDDKDRTRRGRWSRHPHVSGVLMVGFITSFTIVMLADLVRSPVNAVPFGRVVMIIAFPIFLWTTIGLSAWYGKRLRRQLADRLQAAQCCDCGYQLDLGKDGLGPKRCLECGCPWPLVPPALPPSPSAGGFFALPASWR